MVVPALGRPWLDLLLASIRAATARGPGPRPVEVLVVDDRPFAADGPNPPLDLGPDPVPGVRVLRSGGAAGLFVGVMSNRPVVRRGHLAAAHVDTVDRQVCRVLGRVDTWQLCTHAPGAGCTCREPEAGLVIRAAAELGVLPAECLVVGDVRTGIGAAVASGARSVVMPRGSA